MDSTIQPATWGAIFDWDGVIIDSSSHHEESWERLARETGKPLPPGHFKKGFGRKNEFIIPEILEWTREAAEIERFSLRKEALYREVVAERGVEALPGVRLWLERLREARVPCVIGSSTHRANVELSLDLLGLGDSFFPGLLDDCDIRLHCVAVSAPVSFQHRLQFGLCRFGSRQLGLGRIQTTPEQRFL